MQASASQPYQARALPRYSEYVYLYLGVSTSVSAQIVPSRAVWEPAMYFNIHVTIKQALPIDR